MISTRAQMLAATSTPVLGLFAESHIPFYIDRGCARDGGLGAADCARYRDVPLLDEMVAKALELLDSAEPGAPGFFLMIEGSRIDHAAHQNDAGTQAREVLAYDRAVKLVAEYAEKHPDVLVVAQADHDTGGLALGDKDHNYVRPCLLCLAYARAATDTFCLVAIARHLSVPTGVARGAAEGAGAFDMGLCLAASERLVYRPRCARGGGDGHHRPFGGGEGGNAGAADARGSR